MYHFLLFVGWFLIIVVKLYVRLFVAIARVVEWLAIELIVRVRIARIRWIARNV